MQKQPNKTSADVLLSGEKNQSTRSAALMAVTLRDTALAQAAQDWRAQVETLLALRLGGGTRGREAAVVLFAAPAGETWTLVVRKASGETCFLATGSNWVAQPLPATGKDG